MTLTCRGTDRSAEHHRVSGPAIWCRLQEQLSWPQDGGGGLGGGHQVLAPRSGLGTNVTPAPWGPAPCWRTCPGAGVAPWAVGIMNPPGA